MVVNLPRPNIMVWYFNCNRLGSMMRWKNSQAIDNIYLYQRARINAFDKAKPSLEGYKAERMKIYHCLQVVSLNHGEYVEAIERLVFHISLVDDYEMINDLFNLGKKAKCRGLDAVE